MKRLRRKEGVEHDMERERGVEEDGMIEKVGG